jgi:hypothetical protein
MRLMRRSGEQRSVCRHRHHFFSSDSFSPQRWRHACKNVVDRRAGQGPFEYQRIGDGLDFEVFSLPRFLRNLFLRSPAAPQLP